MTTFRQLIASLGLTLSTEQENQFRIYYEMLVETNEQFNLTAITKQEEVYIKHFYDSLLTVDSNIMKHSNTLCDIGTGAGFPGIPIKIMYPHIKLTLIEPTTKKVTFLTQLVNRLGLTGVTIENKRAEDIIRVYREQFDVVTARAVARLNTLAELCIPFVRIGGLFVSLKGAMYLEELEEAKDAISKLGASVLLVKKLELPSDLGVRGLILVEKTSKTNPQFPRSYATIKKRPL